MNLKVCSGNFGSSVLPLFASRHTPLSTITLKYLTILLSMWGLLSFFSLSRVELIFNIQMMFYLFNIRMDRFDTNCERGCHHIFGWGSLLKIGRTINLKRLQTVDFLIVPCLLWLGTKGPREMIRLLRCGIPERVIRICRDTVRRPCGCCCRCVQPHDTTNEVFQFGEKLIEICDLLH